MFALAMAAGLSDVETRRAALEALPRVAVWPTPRLGSARANPTLDVSDEHRRLFEWIVRGGGGCGVGHRRVGGARP